MSYHINKTETDGRNLTFARMTENEASRTIIDMFWFDFCFTALQHILDHFGRG